MIKLAYIQKHEGEFFSDSAFTFWKGCGLLGIPTVSFEQTAGIESLDLTKETLVFGGINPVRKAFDRLGVPQPTVGEMPPPEVLEFYGRRVWATTMAEVRQGYEDNRLFFIKPLKVHKAFPGHIMAGSLNRLAMTAGFDNAFEVMASDVVYFTTEYRLFIHEGRIRDCRYYKGNFRIAPDFTVADRFLAAYRNAPVAYSLDLGVTEDGQTLVIEVNDAFSLGHYGMPAASYAQMVIDRWEEIVSYVRS